MDDFGDEASVLELWDREERTRDSGSDPGLFAGGATARKSCTYLFPRPAWSSYIAPISLASCLSILVSSAKFVPRSLVNLTHTVS